MSECDIKHRLPKRVRNSVRCYLILKILDSDFLELPDRKRLRQMKEDWSAFCYKLCYHLFCVCWFSVWIFEFLWWSFLFCFVSFIVFTFLALAGLEISPGHFYETFTVVRLTRDSLAASELFLNWTEPNLLNSPYLHAWSCMGLQNHPLLPAAIFFKAVVRPVGLCPTFSKARLR